MSETGTGTGRLQQPKASLHAGGNIALRATPRLLALFAGAVLLVALAVLAAFQAFRQIESTSEARKNAYELVVSADALLAELIDAESSQRGFALTGDEAFLEPYLAVRNGISGHLEALRQVIPSGAARKHLDAMVPTVAAKLAHMSRVIELRRSHGADAVLTAVNTREGKRLMDAIRAEMRGFVQLQREVLAEHAAALQSKMRYLFAIIVAVSLFSLLFALSFAYLIYRETQHRLMNLVYIKTQQMLEVQEETSRQLRLATLAKSDFLSNMSHELRTPLNAILGFAQLMESGVPPATPSQKRNLNQILKAGWYLLELINEILDLALIESGKVTLSREPVALADVMLECRAMVEPQAQKRGIGMTFPQFEIPCFVKADRTRVKQVLINLLFNAVKYNKPAGTVVVDYTLRPPNSIRINIRDSGAGLSAEQLRQLFQPFNRLGQESGAEQGTGIGLVVTKRLVELMGGTIGAESTLGVGSVFWFELNLAPAPQLAKQQAGDAALARPQAPEGTPVRTLLYVEDNPANLELVEQLVARRPDLRLLSAADAELGIEFARSYQPEVILMDINLPGISGTAAMKILGRDPSTAHIPIIALSANAMPRDIENGLNAGFFGYLTKPIKVNEFMDALDVALKFSRSASDRAARKEPAL